MTQEYLGSCNKKNIMILYPVEVEDCNFTPGGSGTGTTYFADETTLHLDGSNTFSIDTGYIGQTSIVTLGTVTTGVWNGTPVTVPYGGTGQSSFTAHGVLLGSGSAALNLATVATAGRMLLDKGAAADPAFVAMQGDATLGGSGDLSIAKVHGVTYPGSPSTNTVPVVTSSNMVTYQTVPNAALTNSSLTVSAGTGLTGGGAISLGGSTSLALSTPVTVANGGTGLATLTSRAVLLGSGTAALNFATTGTSGNLFIDQGASLAPSFVAMSGAGTITNGGVVTINKVTGISDGSSAAAGIVGEVFTSTLAIGSAVSLTNITAKTVTSITLTAGRWMIFGLVGAIGTSLTTLQQLVGDINTTTNTLSSDESHYSVVYPDLAYQASGGTLQPQIAVPMQYVTISGSTTYYLIARAQFSASTCTGFGRITAVRI